MRGWKIKKDNKAHAYDCYLPYHIAIDGVIRVQTIRYVIYTQHARRGFEGHLTEPKFHCSNSWKTHTYAKHLLYPTNAQRFLKRGGLHACSAKLSSTCSFIAKTYKQDIATYYTHGFRDYNNEKAIQVEFLKFMVYLEARQCKRSTWSGH